MKQRLSATSTDVPIKRKAIWTHDRPLKNLGRGRLDSIYRQPTKIETVFSPINKIKTFLRRTTTYLFDPFFPNTSTMNTSKTTAVFAVIISITTAWIPLSSHRTRGRFSSFVLSVSIPDKSDALDVDFERVVDKNAASQQSQEQDNDRVEDSSYPFGERPRTLFDVSFESGDPKWKETRIPFCRGNEYIDGKLAFMVDLEGVSYGIATPFDDAVAIVEEINEGEVEKVNCVDPDDYESNEEYQELMEIMAAQVAEQLGEEYALRKTPKVLTISGGLSKLTDNWERELVPKAASVEELLEQEDKDEDLDEAVSSFLDFMKEELGEEEFEKTMNEDELTEEEMELAKFFDIPGMGTQKDDLAGFEELVSSIQDDIEGVKNLEQFQPETERASLKLIGYNLRGGKKAYSLVKLLQPYVLIGKHIQGEKGDIRFDLLTAEEESVVAPKLAELCQEDLEAAGLSLPRNTREEDAGTSP